MYTGMNAAKVLKNVNACIEELAGAYDCARMDYTSWSHDRKAFRIGCVCDELSIFDWWNENLSMSQLKQMKRFLETAIRLGYTGYVCFKVGAAGCGHGMWAHRLESTNGYSPDEGGWLYHSFRSGDNYYDVKFNDGTRAHKDCSLKEVKEMLRAKGEL